MWGAIAAVSSGITLIAFLAAVVAWVYRQKLSADRELIRTAPTSERATIILARYGKLFDVDVSQLQQKQQYDIVIRQLDQRAHNLRLQTLVVLSVAVLFAVVAVVAIRQYAGQAALKENLKVKDRQIAEIATARKHLEVARDKHRLESARIATAVDFATALISESDSSPAVKRLAKQLRDLIDKFEAEVEPQLLTDTDRRELRHARALLALEQKQYQQTLDLITEEDLMLAQAGTDKASAREVVIRQARADALYGLRKWKDAVPHYQRICALRQSDAVAMVRLADCYTQLEHFQKAMTIYSDSVARVPPDAAQSLAFALHEGGPGASCIVETPSAIFDDPLKILDIKHPNQIETNRDVFIYLLANTYVTRGKAYAYNRQFTFSEVDFQTALRLLEMLKGDARQFEFLQALALNELGWMHATYPDQSILNGKKAVQYATRSCELTDWQLYYNIDTLAAALAQVGNFEEAVKRQKQAIAAFDVCRKMLDFGGSPIPSDHWFRDHLANSKRFRGKPVLYLKLELRDEMASRRDLFQQRTKYVRH